MGLSAPRGERDYDRNEVRPRCVKDELPVHYRSLFDDRYKTVRRIRVMIGQSIHKWVTDDWIHGSEFNTAGYLSNDQYSN